MGRHGRRVLDLQTFAPPPWNASVASAIEIGGDLVRIVGTVEEFIFQGTLPTIGARQPCLWEPGRKADD